MRKVELLLEAFKFGHPPIKGYLFEPDHLKVKKVLFVMHGMTEHMGRYEKLASDMIEDGVAVVGVDLRGHGKTNIESDVASFGKDGWDDVLVDLHLFYDFLIHHYIDAKIYILGFSLGSFLLREYINKYHKDYIDGAIIMGTGTQPSFVLSMVMSAVKSELNKVGYDHSSPLIKKLSFGEYNKKFKPNKTDFDWLCSDEKSLKDYIEDTLCKKEISAGLFYDLLSSMKKTSDIKTYENARKDLPVLLISGEKDPVGNMGKGVKQVYSDMKKAGFDHIQLELLPHVRHDILHESSVYENVLSYIRDFINE